MQKKALLIIIGLGVLALVLTQSLFIVDQTEKALVLALGKPLDKTLDPGLHVKLPFIQNVIYFNARILDYDARPEEITTKDKKLMKVDSYTKWKIENPLEFYRTAKNVEGAQARMADIVRSNLREALGRYTFIEIVSAKRKEIMDAVTISTKEKLKDLGIDVVDVRIIRTDLPTENARAIFGRMKAERERQAKQYRSEGQEESAKIKATADKERTILLAEAQRKAEVIRGEGDAQATKIYAEAMNQSPEFYAFMRSMEAYQNSFKANSRFIMTPKSPFLEYLQ